MHSKAGNIMMIGVMRKLAIVSLERSFRILDLGPVSNLCSIGRTISSSAHVSGSLFSHLYHVRL